MVLEDTVERSFHGGSYANNPSGVLLIRGENVVLLGEVVSVSYYAVISSLWDFFRATNSLFMGAKESNLT